MAMWPEDEQHDTRIDAAIDDVARRMTEGEPSAALKTRVLARIDEQESSHRGWHLAWIVSPIAAAAVMFLIVVARPFEDHNRRAEVSAPQPPMTQRVDQQLGPTPRQPAAQATVAQPPTQIRLKPDATFEIQSRPSEIDALALEPLDVESIRVAALPPAESIRVDPLETIAPIDAAPLGSLETDDPQRRQQ